MEQATSNKQQATSNKQQVTATSNKPETHSPKSFFVKRLALGVLCTLLLSMALSACPEGGDNGGNGGNGDNTNGGVANNTGGHLSLEVIPTNKPTLSPIDKVATFELKVSGFASNDAARLEGPGIVKVTVQDGLWYRVDDKSTTGTTKVFVLSVNYDGTKSLPGAQAAVGVELDIKNLPKDHRYSGGIQTTSIDVVDGKDRNRPIPVTKDNIQAFNFYTTDPNSSHARGQHYILTENIVLPSVAQGKSNWTAIGSISYGAGALYDSFDAFYGSFNGNGFTISGLRIHAPDAAYEENNYQGFFRALSRDAVVENLGLLDVNVTGVNYVGGLVGHATGSVVRNCYVTGKVTGVNYVGGLVGLSPKPVQNSFAKVDVSSTGNYVGGLTGSSQTVQNSYATGTVTSTGTGTGTGNNVGGLTGYSSQTVQNSYAEGTVTSTGNNVGGLVGQNYGYGSGGIVQNSYAAVKVTGNNHVGGLVGKNYGAASGAGIVRNSYATGDVSGNEEVGGLVGHNYGWDMYDNLNAGTGVVQNSYATGSVSGNNDVGGIVGWNESVAKVQNCVALNPSVYRKTGSSSPYIGRVAGDSINNASNYAFLNMSGPISTQSSAWSGQGSTHRNGQDMSGAQLKAANSFQNVFGTNGPWTFATGRLPGFGETFAMPSHIQ